MASVPQRGSGSRQRALGAIGRFVTGIAIGAVAVVVTATRFGSTQGEGGLILLALVLAGAGFVAALVGGIAAFTGTWLGAAGPFAVPALAMAGECTPLSPVGVCAEPLGLLLAGALLLFGLVPEVIGFQLGRFARRRLGAPKQGPG
jgi:hypothetical protein